jgi:hypothetical protein
LNSLDAIENYLSQPINCTENGKNRSARYLGEVFRKNYGGNWDLCNDGPNYIYNGLPIIKNFSEVDFEFCPLAVIENYVITKRDGLLKGAIESCINP